MDTEFALNKLESLLHTIAKLYSGVFATIMNDRVHTYHADTPTSDNDDIGDVLRAYIKQLQHHASHHQADTTDPALPPEPVHDHVAVDGPETGLHETPLSDYFKKYNALYELSPPLAEKLKISAWEHTHSAIRFAHQGDYASAKLHADLANNAIHELGHFMSAADFTAFKRAVKSELLSKT